MMSDLSISHQQAVEIAKAVSYDASVVVMDEPTSSLTEKEVDHLFRIIRDLTSRNVAVIYISHKMSEIFRISDEVSIMRDGKMLGTWPASELDEDELIRHMVGRESRQRFPEISFRPGPTRLRVLELSSPDPRSFQGVSFEVKEGEILGIGGLVGSQRTELVEALFGLRPVASGIVEVGGRRAAIRHSSDAILLGMGLITEDRRGSGIFPLLSLTVNTALPSLHRWRNGIGFLKHSDIAKESKRLNDSLRTKAPHMETPIQNLSGGNQQKVLVSRWLMTLPDILIMDEPTRGIDVGAKYEIYTIMSELVANGKSIIMVSSEMPELLGMSHRILVLCSGRATGVLSRDEANQESVMRLAAQYD
jgi:methyl-galactoside transport system ATP-binding protein